MRTEGPRGLFAGLGTSLTSNVPFIGVSWATFTTGKRVYNEAHGLPPLHKPSVPALLGLSVLATGAAEVVAYPLYMVKTNMQNDVAAGSATSSWETARRIYATRGPLGFYHGVSIAWLKSAPAACITYYVYETVKSRTKS